MKNKETAASRISSLDNQINIFSDISKKKGSILFLGKYTLREAGIVLKKKSFIKEAKKRKLWPIDVVIDSSEFPPLQRIQMFYKSSSPENLLVDLKIKEGGFSPKTVVNFDFNLSNHSLLVIEWLTLQNPLLKFSQEKSPLPGQEHPGLNLGRKVMTLFVYLAQLNKNDGILAFPAYFHNALLFSRRFHFLNPEKEAEVEVIRKAFKDISFKQLAWIVHLNCLRDKNDEIYEWKAEEQLFPLNKTFKEYFESKTYQSAVKETMDSLDFIIDWPSFHKKWKEL